MEVGRSLGKLLERGWRPERTIVLAGWDGEEYGLLGSTQWVEQFQRDLRRNAVAYANLDGAGGPEFSAAGVPQLDDAIVEVTKAVQDPRTGESVFDGWTEGGQEEPELGRLGSGSDYTAFLDHVGVPAFEAGFTNPASSGTYHSAYDDIFNMERHLDPGYLGHAGSSRITGVTALRLANADILPFRYSDYAAAVVSYVEELQAVQREGRLRLAGRSLPIRSRELCQRTCARALTARVCAGQRALGRRHETSTGERCISIAWATTSTMP